MTNRTIAAVAAAACAIALAPGSAWAKAKVHVHKVYTVQDEAARGLKDIEEQASELNDHALTMQSATNNTYLDREFFAGQLNDIRDDVNSIGKDIARLEALSGYENSSEREVIGKVKPVLQKIAAATEANMAYLRDKPQQLDLPAFRTLTTSLSDLTGSFWRELHDSVGLTNVARREEKLKQDLASVEGR